MDNKYIIPVVLILFILFKFYKYISAKKKIPELLSQGGIIVDVRSTQEFKARGNPLSKNIPLHELSDHIHELDKDRPIILCCASGARSSMAARMLKKNGFKKIFNAGSWTNTRVKSSAPLNS